VKLTKAIASVIVLILAICAFSSFTHAATIGLWLLDEGSGTAMADSSGNGNNASIAWAGSGSWSTDSPFEPNAFLNSYAFGPTQVNVSDNTVLNPTGAFTIECWVKFDTLNGNPYVISKRNVGGLNSGYWL
jgi:hypothetical protein